MQNILLVLFDVKSEGFQAMTELKQKPADKKYLVSQAVLVSKEADKITTLDAFDTGVDTTNDTVIGGLVGMTLGIIGGPIGMLLGGSLGSLTGANLDLADAIDDASLLEQIADKLDDGEVALVGLTYEEEEADLDARFAPYKATVIRYDAAVVAQEVEEARELQAEMARMAVRDLRKQKTEEFKEKVEVRRENIQVQMDEQMKKYNAEGLF